MLIDEQQSRWKVVILRENVDGWTIVKMIGTIIHIYDLCSSLLCWVLIYFIYKKMRFNNFRFNFFRISTVERGISMQSKVLCCAFCNSMVFNFQQFQQISINFYFYFFCFPARLFVIIDWFIWVFIYFKLNLLLLLLFWGGEHEL